MQPDIAVIANLRHEETARRSAIDRAAPVLSRPRRSSLVDRPGGPTDHRRNRSVRRPLGRRTTCRRIHHGAAALQRHNSFCSAPACSAPQSCGAHSHTASGLTCTHSGDSPRAGGQTSSPPQMSWSRAPHQDRRACWRFWPSAGPWSRPSIRRPCGWSYPTSAGLVYRPGDVSGMAAALLRLLTSPALRHGMASRAGEVARRHHLADEAAAARRRERRCVTSSGDY